MSEKKGAERRKHPRKNLPYMGSECFLTSPQGEKFFWCTPVDVSRHGLGVECNDPDIMELSELILNIHDQDISLRVKWCEPVDDPKRGVIFKFGLECNDFDVNLERIFF